MKILSRTIRKARGKHCARLRYIDDDGKKHELLRTAENKSEAKTKLAQLETELMEKGPARLEAGKITFRQLAEYAIKRFYQPATYDGTGRKVSGVRSVVPARSAISNLVAYFGDRDIRKIDDEALEKFKTHRLKTVSIAPQWIVSYRKRARCLVSRSRRSGFSIIPSRLKLANN